MQTINLVGTTGEGEPLEIEDFHWNMVATGLDSRNFQIQIGL